LNPEPKISSDKNLIVDFIDCIEPNNGRMLWQVNVNYKSQIINSKLFQNNWNCFNFEIKNWKMNDSSNKFYFLPIEGNSKLIIQDSFKIIKLPYQSVSTVRFLGNKFVGTNLIEVYDDQLVITDLLKLTSRIEKIGIESRIEYFR